MSGLKQELGLGQGVGLLSTSLLGTGVFAVPALAGQVAARLDATLDRALGQAAAEQGDAS